MRFSGHLATQALKRLAERDGGNSWMQLAVLSSVGQRRSEFFAALMNDREARAIPHVRTMILALASQIGAANVPQELAVFTQRSRCYSPHRARVGAELLKTIIAVRPPIRDLLGEGGGARKAFWRN